MDIQECMKILAGREVCEHGGSSPHDPPPPQAGAEPLGQVIDLLPPAPEATAEAKETVDAPHDEAVTEPSPEARAEASVAKLLEGLAGLDVRGLVGAFRQAQEERAQTYARFDDGLGKVLVSRAFQEYDALCAEATATFAALSNMVNAVAQCLAGAPHARPALAGLLRKVQVEEKEKLALSAALHLERCRLATSTCGGSGKEGAVNANERLLREGVKALEGRIGEVKGRINDLLEELRYEGEEEEEGQE